MDSSYIDILISPTKRGEATAKGKLSAKQPMLSFKLEKRKKHFSSFSTLTTAKTEVSDETMSSNGTTRLSTVAPSADCDLGGNRSALNLMGEEQTRGVYLNTKFGQAQLNTFSNVPMSALKAKNINQENAVDAAIYQRAEFERHFGILEGEIIKSKRKRRRKFRILLLLLVVFVVVLGLVVFYIEFYPAAGDEGDGSSEASKEPVVSLEELRNSAGQLCAATEPDAVFSVCLSESQRYSCKKLEGRIEVRDEDCASCECPAGHVVFHTEDPNVNICGFEGAECDSLRVLPGIQ